MSSSNSNSRNLRRVDPFHDPVPYRTSSVENPLWDRVSQPGVLVPLIILLCTIAYQVAVNHAASRGRRLASPLELLWDAIVAVTPATLLYAVDHWVNPPLFPLPMVSSSEPTTHTAKSDVMKRILGLDRPGGIVASVSQAGRRTLSNGFSGALGFKGALSQPAGLGNWDNSCYQNSILQGLASLKPLPAFLSRLAIDGNSAQIKTDTTETLRDLVADLNHISNNGKTLWTPAVLKNMSSWQQQDAQEYFSKLLDELDTEASKTTKALRRPTGFESDNSRDDTNASQHSDDSGYQSLSTISKGATDIQIVRNPLEGLLAQRVACVACGYSEGLSMIPFNCLTLNLGMHRTEFDLYERLDSYVQVESIQGVECTKCTLLKYRNLLGTIIERSRKAGFPDSDFPEPHARMEAIEAALEEEDFDDKTLKSCKITPQSRVNSTKTKQAVISRPPQSLAIHMNRSVFDETTGHMFKNLAGVRFPMTLDLGPWCLGSADALTSQTGSEKAEVVDEKASSAIKGEEEWLLDPTASMVAGDLHPSKITGPIYELRAVVTHYGRHENGHYVCYRKHPRAPTTREEDGTVEKSDQPAQLASDEHSDDTSSIHEKEPGDEDHFLEASETPVEEPQTDSQWWRLSDQDVTPVTEETVLAQGGVFMLFYDCVDPNSVLTSEVDSAADLTPKDTSTDQLEPSTAGNISTGSPADESAQVPSDQAGAAQVEEVLKVATNVPLPSGDDGLEENVASLDESAPAPLA